MESNTADGNAVMAEIETQDQPDWPSVCIEPPAESKSREALCTLARDYFQSQRKEESDSVALSQFLAALGPVLSPQDKSGGKLAPRARALYLLRGAIEGCSSPLTSSDVSAGTTGLSLSVIDPVGSFLVGHCRPFQQDYTMIDADEDDDMGETVRDAALEALSSLVSVASCDMPIQVEDNKEDDSNVSLMKMRLILAKRGVEARCLVEEFSDYEPEYDHGYDDQGDGDAAAAAMEGLATLPRARRSLCFVVLESAVNASEDDVRNLISSQAVTSAHRKAATSFVMFVATCLHGETDPRCLLQMLCLLHRCQEVFLPLFQASWSEIRETEMDVEGIKADNDGDDIIFPTVSMFDAVAPYYPIKFTPPPNDPHGITREGLRSALMSILCAVERNNAILKSRAASGSDGDEDDGFETMITLAAGLFLERLVPPKSHDPYGEDFDYQDGADSALDKTEAINDLKELLLPSMSDTDNHPLETVGAGLIKEISSALVTVHSDAIADLSTAFGPSERDNVTKLLESCRALASGVASVLEDLDDDVSSPSSPWSVFVLDIVRELSSGLVSAPQGMKGRSSTAYLASLAACGGVRTLRTCLDGCLPPLIDILQNYSGDEEKAAAAALATGTMLSSSKKCLSQATKAGVIIHPHPLQQYASDAIRALVSIGKEGEIGLKTAATTALGATFLAVPSNILSENELDMVHNDLISMANYIVERDDDKDADDFVRACSQIIGSALAHALNVNESDGVAACVLNDNEESIRIITKQILPSIVDSATKKDNASTSNNIERFDRRALAKACEVGGEQVSQLIVSQLLSLILREIKACKPMETEPDMNCHPAIPPSVALSYILRNGAGYSAIAFHILTAPSVTPFDVVEALCSYQGKSGYGRQLGMSKLVLPNEIEQEKKEAASYISLAYQILPHLIPAYRAEVPMQASELERIIGSVSKVLPPLSQGDNVQLSVMLPLVATILDNPSAKVSTYTKLMKDLESMAPSLADFSLCKDWNADARSAASTCLFQTMLHYQQDKTKCIGPAILKDYISPSLFSAVDEMEERSTEKNGELRGSTLLRNSLDLCAVVGSAAACRGGTSSSTADAVTRFLVGLACNGESQVPFLDKTIKLGNNAAGSTDYQLLLMAASSFGSMISVQNGGPFWRQRMIHMSMPSVLEANEKKSSTTGKDSLSAVSGPPIGALALSCHIACCTPLVVLGEKRAEDLINMIARGFVEFANARTGKDGSSSHFIGWSDLMSGLLASLLKFISGSPDQMLPYLAGLIPNFLVVCTVGKDLEDIPCQLLALECLVSVTHIPSARRICKAHKLSVTCGLEELVDHPSSILRHATVETRNVWSVLG